MKIGALLVPGLGTMEDLKAARMRAWTWSAWPFTAPRAT